MRGARAPQQAGEPSTAAVMCRLCLVSLARGTSATLRAPLASRVLHDFAQRWEFLGDIFEHASLFARKSGFATACPGRLINALQAAWLLVTDVRTVECENFENQAKS